MSDQQQSINDNYLAYLVRQTFNDFTSKQNQMFDTIKRRIQSQEDDVGQLKIQYDEVLNDQTSLFQQLNSLTCGGVVLDQQALQHQIQKHQTQFNETLLFIEPFTKKLERSQTLQSVAQIQLTKLKEEIDGTIKIVQEQMLH